MQLHFLSLSITPCVHSLAQQLLDEASACFFNYFSAIMYSLTHLELALLESSDCIVALDTWFDWICCELVLAAGPLLHERRHSQLECGGEFSAS